MINEKTNSQDKAKKEEAEKLAKDIAESYNFYTIPKNFIAFSQQQKKSKGVGIMIFAFGIFLLFSVFGAFYYFVIYSNPIKNIEPVSGGTAATTTDGEKMAEDQPPASLSGADIFENEELGEEWYEPFATGTDEEMTATGTEESDEEIKIIEHKQGSIFKTSTDSDFDGLSDLEEVLLSTMPDSADTDNDGYDDMTEMNNMYNPAGSGKLSESPDIAEFQSDIYEYSILYPKIWSVQETGGSDTISFDIGNGQMVQLIIQPKAGEKGIEEWYMEQFDIISIDQSQRVIKDGWTGVKNDDGLTYYLANQSSSFVFTLNYNIGLDNVLYYRNIFEMMIKSLEILP